jgi:cell fate (sporulation/competence/biofilm development) regulator YlbF (YheA/YmcA/DUF963 family)
MNEIIKKAEELAMMIKTSKEALLAEQTEEIYKNDEKAQEMIRSYNDKRRDAAVKMQYSELSDEEMDALRKEISEAYDELMSYDVISNFVEAQAQLEELNNQVMSVLGEITGAGGCGSGGCSSCSGCH